MHKPSKKVVQNTKKRLGKVQNLLFQMNLDKVLRDSQITALDWADGPLMSGKKFLITQMPTGSGKSIYSQYFIDKYLKKINAKANTDIVTATKILQQQYVREFEWINNLNGKSNYECVTHETNCEYGAVIGKSKGCGACEECPYNEARDTYFDGRISVTNFHVMGLNRIHNPMFNEARKADLLIIDEGHLIEDVINGFLSINITQRMFDRYLDFQIDSVRAENYSPSRLADINEIQSAVRWIERTFLPDLEASKRNLTRSQDEQKIIDSANHIKKTEEIITRFKEVCINYRANPNNYVLDYKYVGGELALSIQPLWTGELLDKYIYSHYKHVLIMSGTIIDPETFMKINGISPERAAYLEIDSTFPAENRPIYYYPLGKMSLAKKHETWKDFVPTIKRILKKYDGKKGIIHAGTYEIMTWLMRDVKDDRLIFAHPDTREAALAEHINSTSDTILVSPSMVEGVDLADDSSRFQIILKMPYPSLESIVNRTRKDDKNHPQWFSVKTIQKLIQAYGRSVRSESDHADTFILDACFGDVLRYNSRMIPKYVHDSIKYLKVKAN